MTLRKAKKAKRITKQAQVEGENWCKVSGGLTYIGFAASTSIAIIGQREGIPHHPL